MGDLNSNPPEAEFTNFTAAGQGEAFDPDSVSPQASNTTVTSTTTCVTATTTSSSTSQCAQRHGEHQLRRRLLHSFGNNGTTLRAGPLIPAPTLAEQRSGSGRRHVYLRFDALCRPDHRQRPPAGGGRLHDCLGRRHSGDRIVRGEPDFRYRRRFSHPHRQQC